MAVTPKIRRTYKGAPVQTTLGGSGVTSTTMTSISLSTSPSTWPTGKFFVVVAPGTASEEKMCVTVSGSTMTVVDPNVASNAASVNGRGVDNTTARSSIATGSVVYPVATAIDFDDANSLTSTYANQGGIVYMGDPSFTQLGIGTVNQVLRVNTGATAPEWGQVATAGIADGAVTSAKIANDTIVNEDINSAAAIADTKLATISTADKVSISALNIDGATDIGADLADADLIIVDDGAGGTNRKSAISRFAKFLFSKVSGDITITDAGVATIGSTKVGTTNIVDGAVTSAKLGPLTVNSQTGTSYILVLADANRMIEMSNASAITLTVPTNASVAFPTGTNITVMQTGAGQITVGGAGVTLRTAVALKSRAQWSALTLYKRGTDDWVVFGDTAA